MRRGVIDQIMLWIVIFVSFVVIFLLAIDYYIVLKAKDKCDMMANYAVRMKALGKDNDSISNGLNNISNNYFNNISIEDDWCSEDSSSGNFQVKVEILLNLSTRTFITSNIKSYASAFNEVNDTNINCSLQLTKN